jgi:hypothetical protein
MVASSVRRSLWIAFLALSTSLGVAACGAEDLTANEEETSEIAQPICEGWDWGARNCTVLCCAHQNWNNLGPKPEGTCTEAGKAYCTYAGGLCGACWSW